MLTLRTGHPVIDPRRHGDYSYKNARNRVWLARRNLPWPLAWIYVGSWTGVHLVRWVRSPGGLGDWSRGWLDGWRHDPWDPSEQRRTLRWRDVARMARHGRLLVI